MYIKIEHCMNCGVRHYWDYEGPTLKEMRTIKKVFGFTGEDFANAAAASDPEALAALLYTLHIRDNIKVDPEEIDLDFSDFEMDETEEEKKEREALEKAAETEEKIKDGRPGPKDHLKKSGQTQKAGSHSR